MGRTSFSMRPMAEALEEAGFEVLNHDYSSVCCPIPELGEQLRQAILARLTEEHTAVHFVGHSLGNILIRWVLTRDTLPPRVGRAVMLAPPNQGAAMADRFASVGGWLLKPIDGLRTDSLSVVRALPPVRGVGIVVVAAADDHTVQVEETRLPEALAHVVVEGGHTFIMRREEVQALTITFLRTGRVPETSAGRVDR
jgi:predicted alpha/beta hydrolase family esterase